MGNYDLAGHIDRIKIKIILWAMFPIKRVCQRKRQMWLKISMRKAIEDGRSKKMRSLKASKLLRYQE